LATQLWVQNSAGTITANLKGDIYTAGGLRVLDNGTTLANPAFFGDIYASNGTSKILENGTDGTNAAFTGSVTGNVTGNLTGNVTGNLTGNVTGNVTGNLTGNVTGNTDTATKLAATKNINGVAFDGSANITVNTLVNGANTLTLGATGTLTLPAGGTLTSSGNSTKLIANSNTGSWLELASYNETNFISVYGTGILIATDSANFNWQFDTDGVLTAPGNITTTSGIVSASAVTTTNDVIVGGNAIISTAPSLTTHATNKKYVDKKATAMAIALS
jgi:hypothetical protein